MALPKTYVAGFHDEAAVRRVKYVKFGETGLYVSAMSLGGGPFGIHYGEYDRKECIELIRKAIRSGINYIDTAHFYGQGKSEELIGEALKGVPREAYYIATKIGRYSMDFKKMFDFSYKATIENFDQALKRLQLDYVDVIQVHDIEFASDLEEVLTGALPALADIVKSGRAGFIGVTGYPVSVLKECIERSSVKISTVLCYTRLTLIDRTLLDYLEFFKKKGLAVINASVVGMGLLTNDGPQFWHPGHEKTKEVCREAAKYCQARGVELGKLAVHFALSQTGPDTVLIGMNDTRKLDLNLETLRNGLTEKEEIVLKEIMDIYFTKEFPRHWEGVEIKAYKEKMLE